jgi:hypothetical protein
MMTGADISVGDKVRVLLSIDALDYQKKPSSYRLELRYLDVRFALCVNIVCGFIVGTVRKSLHGSTCVYKAARFLVDRSNALKVEPTLKFP